MLENSTFSIDQFLAFEAAEEFGAKEGTAFVNGASALQPSGFMQDVNVAYTPGTDASLVKADGIIDIYHALKPAYRGNAYWVMNSTTLGSIRKLKDSTTGQYLVATAGINNTPVSTILGRPIVEAPTCRILARVWLCDTRTYHRHGNGHQRNHRCVAGKVQ